MKVNLVVDIYEKEWFKEGWLRLGIVNSKKAEEKGKQRTHEKVPVIIPSRYPSFMSFGLAEVIGVKLASAHLKRLNEPNGTREV
ncbi:CLUMA_CG011695, isoform A [Clunio marinus]|uniref:CLUMA_CG011695, isoform A n=1 Tax=Clunio marinus TaxID=568069 RepID=A0A1J1IDI9_9DIPT|nr:CLUMA_CG011695, isoform A [Clunio marinus]